MREQRINAAAGSMMVLSALVICGWAFLFGGSVTLAEFNTFLLVVGIMGALSCSMAVVQILYQTTGVAFFTCPVWFATSVFSFLMYFKII